MESKIQNGRPPRSGLFLLLMIVVTKGAKFLKVFKAVKFTKVLITIVSMLISAIAYGVYLGPWFGVGLVAMLFIHEMGHVIAMRMKGLGTPAPVFIPFLGALIFVPDLKDRETEAFVGIGGPLLGTIGALACFALWPFAEGKTAEILLLVSYTGIFLNLFNLIPLSPLDGGRVTQVIGSWFRWVGVVLLLIYTVFLREPGFLLIWILVLQDFNQLPRRVRPILSCVLWSSMCGLMLLGYGDQPWPIDLLDVFMGGVLSLVYSLKDARNEGAIEASTDPQREYPAQRVRLRWFFLYGALTALVLATQIYQLQFITPLLQHDAQQEAPASTP